MRIILVGHRWEANCVIVTDSLVEEQALDTDLQAVKSYLGLCRSDHIELPELVQEIEASVCRCNSSIYCGWKCNCDCLLVRAFNELDHGSLKEANEAASKL